MLSISRLQNTPQSRQYHIFLSNQDYYTSGSGEPPGIWRGSGAEHLGLKGLPVTNDGLQYLFDGYSPDGKAALVKNAGSDKRDIAWDLTFSVPKSVSVVWSQANSTLQNMIQQCHATAVEKALEQMENFCLTRRGKGGERKIKAKLIAATFEHCVSRANDPDLHTHAVVMQVVVGEDGKTSALYNNHTFYENKILIGRMYRAELAHQLQQKLHYGLVQDLTLEKGYDLFELKDVSTSLMRHFSKRRQEIEEQLKREGYTSAKAAAVATEMTRQAKTTISRPALFQRWRQEGRNFHYQPPLRGAIVADPAQTQWQAVKAALKRLHKHHSSFTPQLLRREIAAIAPSFGLDIDWINKVTEAAMHSRYLVRLGFYKGHYHFTTPVIQQIEARMLKTVRASRDKTFRPITERVKQQALGKIPFSLNAGQQAVFEHLLDGQGSIKVALGHAGTGKSTVLGAVSEALTLSGYQIVGCAPSGKAAKTLTEATGHIAHTTHALVGRLQRGQLCLTAKSYVLMDEAVMTDTLKVAALVEAARQSGARFALIGDLAQFQAVEQGGAVKEIIHTLDNKVAKATTIIRQLKDWERRAIEQLADGNADPALKRYAEEGHLTIGKTVTEAITTMLNDWQAAGGLRFPENNVMFTGENQHVREINTLAQERRLAAGLLDPQQRLIVGNTVLYAGDYVVLTRNNKQFNVVNGDTAIIEGISGKTLKLRLKDGTSRRISLTKYQDKRTATPHVQLGYSVTGHKGQGATVECAYALLTGSMVDQHQTYVNLSRGKQAWAYTTELDAGDNLKDLIKAAGRNREKLLATTVERLAQPSKLRGRAGR
ncbi:MAG: MobF family relaxase [Cyanobacteria bacterium P01_D01_bin.56]